LRAVTKNESQDYLPSWSPDDREISFVRQETPTPGSGRSTPQETQIVAIDVETGQERQLSSATGRVGPPAWTPDGKQVVYNVIAEGTSRLEMGGRALVTGEDVFPARVQWVSPTEFLYAADGKIKKRSVDGGPARTIEFEASIELPRTKYAHKKYDFDSTAPRKAQGIVRPVISPDASRIAFAALGDVWVMEVGGKPTRLTNDEYIDTDPAWSPDGAQLVFSSDRAEVGNLDLWIKNVKSGKGRPSA
jgi:dipeptidyl aminopeptidase/acylaminoacyl peptidase